MASLLCIRQTVTLGQQANIWMPCQLLGDTGPQRRAPSTLQGHWEAPNALSVSETLKAPEGYNVFCFTGMCTVMHQ